MILVVVLLKKFNYSVGCDILVCLIISIFHIGFLAKKISSEKDKQVVMYLYLHESNLSNTYVSFLMTLPHYFLSLVNHQEFCWESGERQGHKQTVANLNCKSAKNTVIFNNVSEIS